MNWPAELTSIVVSYLRHPLVFNINTQTHQPEQSMAVYSTVSKEWQTVIERSTFSVLRLNPSKLDDFERIVAGSRRSYVCTIQLDVILESYSVEARTRVENDEDRRRNNEIFTQMMHRTFKILHTWSENKVAVHGIALSMCAFSWDDIAAKPYQETEDRRRARGLGSGDILDRRFERSYVDFVHEKNDEPGEQLETVPRVTNLRVGCGWNGRYRYISPFASTVITSKLPHLHDLELWLWDNEKKDAVLREGSRQAFARGLALLPASLRNLSLEYYYCSPADEKYSSQALVSHSRNEDFLSSQLRRFSQQLVSLDLNSMLIGAELFWPKSSDANLPHWPRLTSLSVRYSPVTPSGKWLFDRDEDEEIDEDIDYGEPMGEYMSEDEMPPLEDRYPIYFRHKAAPEPMNDFYRAAGLAVAEMPCLKDLYLEPVLVAGRQHSFQYIYNGSTARATWESTPLFRPHDDVLDIWKNVRKVTGIEVQIVLRRHNDFGMNEG